MVLFFVCLFYCFTIHMCIQGLGHFSQALGEKTHPLPYPIPSLTTHSAPSLSHPPRYLAETIFFYLLNKLHIPLACTSSSSMPMIHSFACLMEL
jgi:hypothetical protein